MPAPQIRVFVDFDSDTAFETNPLILGSATKGILGTNRLDSVRFAWKSMKRFCSASSIQVAVVTLCLVSGFLILMRT